MVPGGLRLFASSLVEECVSLLIPNRERVSGIIFDEFELFHNVFFELDPRLVGVFVIVNRAYDVFDRGSDRNAGNNFDEEKNGKWTE